MAKIWPTSGTEYANGSGNWTSSAIDMGADGSKRVYLRVNGTQVLYRDFTVSSGGQVSIESGYPKSAANVDHNGSAADYVEVTGITTSAASLIAVVYNVNNNGGSRTSYPPTIGGDTGLSFTRVSLDGSIFADNRNGSSVWLATSSGALSNKTLRFTRPAGTDYATFNLTVYSLLGTTGAAGSKAGVAVDGSVSTAQNGLIRPYGDAGSIVLFGSFGTPTSTTMLPSGSWDTAPTGSTVSGCGTGHIFTTDRTGVTVGANTSQTYSGWTAVEIPASGANVVNPVQFLGSWGSAAGGTTSNSTNVTVSTSQSSGMLVALLSWSATSVAASSVTASGLTFTRRTNTSSGGSGSVDIWTAPFSGTLSSLAVGATLPGSANFAYKVIALGNVNASPIGTIVHPTQVNSTAMPDVTFNSCTAGSMLLTNAWCATAPGSGTLNNNTALIDNQNDAGLFRRAFWADTGTNVIGGTGYNSISSMQCGIEIKAA
jgi:hypothetical protein